MSKPKRLNQHLEQVVGQSSFKPRPAYYIIKHVLLKKSGLDSSDLAERVRIDPVELDGLLSGRVALEKRHIRRMRRVFGRAVKPLLRIDRLYDYYVKTGRVHSGRGQVVVPRRIIG